MQLTINDKDYQFIFGYGFIKELNRRYTIHEKGLSLKAGLDTTLANFFNNDIETLVEMLKVGNLTETPKISEKELAEYVAESDIEKLFDEVLEELKKSGFTRMKTKRMSEAMKQA